MRACVRAGACACDGACGRTLYYASQNRPVVPINAHQKPREEVAEMLDSVERDLAQIKNAFGMRGLPLQLRCQMSTSVDNGGWFLQDVLFLKVF